MAFNDVKKAIEYLKSVHGEEMIPRPGAKHYEPSEYFRSWLVEDGRRGRAAILARILAPGALAAGYGGYRYYTNKKDTRDDIIRGASRWDLIREPVEKRGVFIPGFASRDVPQREMVNLGQEIVNDIVRGNASHENPLYKKLFKKLYKGHFMEKSPRPFLRNFEGVAFEELAEGAARDLARQHVDVSQKLNRALRGYARTVHNPQSRGHLSSKQALKNALGEFSETSSAILRSGAERGEPVPGNIVFMSGPVAESARQMLESGQELPEHLIKNLSAQSLYQSHMLTGDNAKKFLDSEIAATNEGRSKTLLGYTLWSVGGGLGVGSVLSGLSQHRGIDDYKSMSRRERLRRRRELLREDRQKRRKLIG